MVPWVGRYLHVLNFTLTILNESKATGSARNYLIAIFQDKECYEALQSQQKDLRCDVEDFAEIKFGSVTHKITYFLGGDYEFLLCIL